MAAKKKASKKTEPKQSLAEKAQELFDKANQAFFAPDDNLKCAVECLDKYLASDKPKNKTKIKKLKSELVALNADGKPEETQAGRTARTAIEKAIDAGEDVAGELAIFSIKVANFIKKKARKQKSKKAKATQKADK